MSLVSIFFDLKIQFGSGAAQIRVRYDLFGSGSKLWVPPDLDPHPLLKRVYEGCSSASGVRKSCMKVKRGIKVFFDEKQFSLFSRFFFVINNLHPVVVDW